MKDIGNGINNVAKGNLSIASVLDDPDLTLFDINNDDCDEHTVVNDEIKADIPNRLSMRAQVIKSSGFLLLKNELTIYQDTTDLFSCQGNYFYFSLLLKGKAYLCTDTKSRRDEPRRGHNLLDQKRLYFHSNTFLQQTIQMKKNERIRYTVLLLHKDYARSLLQSGCSDLLNCHLYNNMDSPVSASVPIEWNMHEAIRSLFNFPSEGQFFPHFARLKLTEILLLLNVHYQVKTEKPFLRPSDLERFQEIKTWIVTHYNEEFTLKSLARNFGLNELVLKTGFKSMFGQTIRQFAIERRMDAAKALLLQNKETINEISSKVGYKSVSHFIQTFKKHFGVTPAQHQLQKLNN